MKRWIAALLSAVLLLSVSGAALAADPDTVEISSAEDLAELSALCTSDAWSEGKTIVLTRDISLTGCDFSPIPLLSGTFDGRGHSILGISLDGDASTQGLFRMVLKSGVVKNLTVSGTLRATGNGENIGGMAITKVYSVWLIGGAAVFAILLSFIGKLSELIHRIPVPVMGGVCILLFGGIAASGLRVLVESKVDYSKSSNLVMTAVIMIIGLSGAKLTFGTISVQGMVLATLVAILLSVTFKILDRLGFLNHI